MLTSCSGKLGDEKNGEGVAEVIRHLLESRQKAFEKAESNIVQAQKYQKEVYDLKHQPNELPEGSLVLLENTAQKQCKGGKLCPAWLGPYTISRNLGKGVYELKNAAGSIVRKKANISRLNVYTCRDGQDPKSGKERNDNRMDSQEDKEDDEKEEEEKRNDTDEGSKGKAKK